MWKTKRRPVDVGEMLKLEFLEPMEITSKTLADVWEFIVTLSVI